MTIKVELRSDLVTAARQGDYTSTPELQMLKSVVDRYRASFGPVFPKHDLAKAKVFNVSGLTVSEESHMIVELTSLQCGVEKAETIVPRIGIMPVRPLGRR